MNEAKTFLFTGGGTAGHVIPAKPLITKLLERGDRVTYIGSKSGLEENLVKDLDIDFKSITTGKLRRYFSIKNLFDFFRVPVGIVQSMFILLRLRPVAVFSKGGYVAFPVVFAAWLVRIPIVAHESDLTPGLATRLCSPFVETQCVNFEGTRTSAKRLVVSGTPVRDALLHGDAERARVWLGFQERKSVLVVVGGSLGAESINEVVREAILPLSRFYNIVHVCGPDNVDEDFASPQEYRQFEFIDEQWGDVLALADVVVSRSGANSLYELLTLNKPNILIPLPLASSRGDQIENAEFAELNGWSLVIPQEKLTVRALIESLELLRLELDSWKTRMQDFAVRDTVALIISELDRVVD